MFNLGKLAEENGNISAARKYYDMGADKGDEACIRAIDRINS
jgi:hypothetical protein